MNKSYWLSSTNMTVFVNVNEQNIIVDCANIIKVFVGQPLDNLIRWMTKQGHFQIKELD